MWRLFTHHTQEKKMFPKNITKYLDDLIASYNNTYHRSIKTTPNRVNVENEKKIRQLMYGDKDVLIKINFKIGDYVRRTLEKELFTKGYIPGWDKEVFLIANVYPTIPPTYTIKALDNTEYSHKFYAQELQLINFEFEFDTFKILEEKGDKILVEKVNSDNLKNWVDKKAFLE